MKKQERYLCRVNNDKEGRNFIQSLKKNLNSDSYRIITRNTGPRPKGTSQASTTRANATSLRLYVESKIPNGDSKQEWLDTQATIIQQKQVVIDSIKLDNAGRVAKLEATNKVLEAKLLLLTERIQNSSKYGSFVKTVNSVATVR